MKWLALSMCLILVLPVSAYMRRNQLQTPKVWMLIGFLPFATQYFHLFMAVDSTPGWGGYVKGAEVSLLDIIALSLYITIPTKGQQPLPFRFVMVFYVCMVGLSAFQAFDPKESLFYSWQLARMFFVYLTVSRGCFSDSRVTRAVMTGMAAGLIMEAAYTLWQRFGLGMIQTPGTEASQNLLGLMSHFVILPFFALLLAGRRGPLPAIVILAGAIVVVSTASRGAVGIESFGLATIFVLSALRKWTSWKARVLLMGVIAVAILVPMGTTSFHDRFAAVPLAEHGYDERDAYMKAAELMLADHPLGVGANQFAVVGNVGHYYERAGVHDYFSALAGNVHNFYYLTAAELGYPGLLALLLLLGSPLLVALRCGWQNRGDERGDLLLGLGIALLAVYIHSWVEWVIVSFSAQYLLAITLGLIAGNAQQLNYWSRVRVLQRPAPVGRPINPISSTSQSLPAKMRK